MKPINTEKIIARINKNKDRPARVTKKWIRETYNLDKTQAAQVKEDYDQQQLAKNLPVKKAVSKEEADGIFSNVTDQEKIFCLEYLKSYNLRNSAVKAGYSPHMGIKLIKLNHIREALKSYQSKREDELFLSGIDIIKMYVGIAFCDITDYVNFGTEEVPLLDGYGKQMYDEDGVIRTYKRSYVRLTDSAKIDGRFIQEVRSGKDGVSVKLFDKMSALDRLSKIFDVNSEAEMKDLKRQLTMAKLDVEKAKAKALDLSEGDTDLQITISRASERKREV